VARRVRLDKRVEVLQIPFIVVVLACSSSFVHDRQTEDDGTTKSTIK
jgi:hypothetical protein